MTVELVRGMLQNNEMVAELRILDYRKNRMENDMEASSRSFDMRCFGPGIPDMGYTQSGWERTAKTMMPGTPDTVRFGRVLYHIQED